MKMEVHELTVRVSVPVERKGKDVTDLLAEVIGEGVGNCLGYLNDPDVAEDAKLVLASDFDVCAGGVVSTYGTDLECKVDFDEAEYFGDADDGVYFQAWEDNDGEWWMSAVVDCDSGGATDSLADMEGPYETKECAMLAGRDCAAEWCGFNDVWGAFEKEDCNDA